MTLGLAWIFGCLALMGPKGNLHYLPFSNQAEAIQNQSVANSDQQLLRRKAHDVIFVVDTSASMSVPDARQGRTRLEEAKDILDEIVSHLSGENVALDAFTSQLTPLVPPTLDYLFTRLVIKQLHINEVDVGGTNIGSALESARKDLPSTQWNKLYTFILMSDGGDHTIEGEEGAKRQKAIEDIVQKLESFNSLNYRLFSIGMGSLEGQTIPNVTDQGKPVHSKLESDLLQQLAQQGRGTYYEANQWNAWRLATDLVNQMGKDAPYEEQAQSSLGGQRKVRPAQEEDRTYDLYFQIPLGLSILFLLLTLILPDARRI
jgi:Ca-activated chloride channel family protein